MMQFVNLATKVIDVVVTSMLQKTEKIEKPLKVLVWTDSCWNLTLQELWILQFIRCPIT